MSARQRAELAALARLPDSAVDTRDIPEMADWDEGEIGKFYRPRKRIVTIRLDVDVLAWFKSRSRKYQTAVNQVLREHVAKNSRRAAASQKTKARSRKMARG